MGHFLEVFWNSKELFLEALGVTILLSLVAVGLGSVIGLFFALMHVSSRNLRVALYQPYVFLIRGTPLIAQIFILYFGLTEIVQIPAFWAAGLALAVHNGAYIAEIFRSMIQSIDSGQSEAARALGFSRAQMYRFIILPQALVRSLAPLGNQFIITVKDSSLAAFISMNELFNVATTLGANNFDQMTYLLVVSIYYLAVVALLSMLVSFSEKRMGYAI